MAELVLEILEGPGAGRQFPCDSSVVIGRAPDADIVLDDTRVSRHQARVTPLPDGAALVEDLGSVHGTFVNHHEVHGSARVDSGDQVLVCVTVLHVRTGEETERPVGPRAVPPALAVAPRTPTYVKPELIDTVTGSVNEGPSSARLDSYLDVRVRRQAQLAPLAVFVLIALVLIIYFGTR